MPQLPGQRHRAAREIFVKDAVAGIDQLLALVIITLIAEVDGADEHHLRARGIAHLHAEGLQIGAVAVLHNADGQLGHGDLVGQRGRGGRGRLRRRRSIPDGLRCRGIPGSQGRKARRAGQSAGTGRERRS